MAWPYDARDHDFSVLGQVPASTLNEVQDVIIDAFEYKTMTLWIGVATLGAAALPSWTHSNGGGYWQCREPVFDLSFEPQFHEEVVVEEVHVKRYLTALGMDLNLDKRNSVISTPADPPTIASVASSIAASEAGYPAWGVDSWTGLAEEIGDEEQLVIRVSDPDVGDRVAGVQIKYYPLKKS